MRGARAPEQSAQRPPSKGATVSSADASLRRTPPVLVAAPIAATRPCMASTSFIHRSTTVKLVLWSTGRTVDRKTRSNLHSRTGEVTGRSVKSFGKTRHKHTNLTRQKDSTSDTQKSATRGQPRCRPKAPTPITPQQTARPVFGHVPPPGHAAWAHAAACQVCSHFRSCRRYLKAVVHRSSWLGLGLA